MGLTDLARNHSNCLDPVTRAEWASAKEYLPIDEVKQALEKAQAAHFGDPITKINLDGIEAVTDELFYALTQELKGLTSLSSVGCIHITDYGVKLLAEEFNGLDEVILDGCRQITAASLVSLSRNCKDLKVVSVKGTNVTHLPEALSDEFKKALKQDALQGCPLIDNGSQDENDPAYLKKYKLVILAKDETKSSVLHFFKNETFKDADPHNDKATYTPDVAFKNVKDFTFNVIESHLPRTMYPPLLSPSGVYVIAIDFDLVADPFLHYMSLLNSIEAQVLNVTVEVLCLHKGSSDELAGIVSMVEEWPPCERQQEFTIDAQLEEESYKAKPEGDRNFLVQVQHMRAKEHRSRTVMLNIFSVNTVTDEVELVWPKRTAKGKGLKKNEEGEAEEEAEEEEDIFAEVNAGPSVNELRVQRDALKEQAEALLDSGAVHLEEAQKAINRVSKKDLSELKSFANPPKAASRCLGHMNLLLGYKVTDPNNEDWKVLKRQISDSSYFQKMANLDKDNVPPQVLKALTAYMEDPEGNPDHLMKFSSACGSFGIYMKGVHAYCTKVAGPVNALRLQLESLKKQIAKIEEGKGLVGKGPALIQAFLLKDLTNFHDSVVPHLHLPHSPAVSAVCDAVAALKGDKIVPLERLMEDERITGKLSGAVVKRVLEHMHDVGNVLFFPDSPNQVITTDMPWFLEVLALIHSLKVKAEFHNKVRVRFLGPEAAVFSQSEFLKTCTDMTAYQASLLFAALEETGILIKIPPAYFTSGSSAESYYFSFADIDEKTFIRESSTEGRHSNSRLTRHFWNDVVDDKNTLVLEQVYRFTYGMPFKLMPRLIADFLHMGFALHVYTWGIVVRHAATEVRLTHTIQMSHKVSRLNVELRTFAPEPTEVIYDYMWSIFSNYLTITEYHIHRFPHLAVRVRQPCRGACAKTRFPNFFAPWEIPRKLGYRAPCPKCGDNNMSEDETRILMGRRRILPFHNMVDGIETTEANNPDSPFNNMAVAEETGSMAQWRCFVCNTRQPASLRLWSYEASLRPAFAVSCFNNQTTYDTETPSINRNGNILSLKENISCGVATLKEPFVTTGMTNLSLMPLSAGKITLGLGYSDTFEKCFREQNFEGISNIFELHTGKLEKRDGETTEELESFSPYDVLSIHIVRQRFTDVTKGRTKEVVELQFQKNGTEFAHKEYPFPLSVALMLEKDDSSDSPQVLVGCPTYAVIRADCFPLKGSLFYKGAVGEHWSLAQVIGTKGGKLIIADSKESDKVAELSPDSDSLMPMCLCAKLTAATIYLGTEIMRSLNEYKGWSVKHGTWPAPPCLFNQFRTSKNKSDFSAAKLDPFEYDSWACSASRHGPEVLHAGAMKALNYRKGTPKQQDRCFLLLPSNLKDVNMFNPHRNIAHDWTAQSLHVICPGKDLSLRGMGSYSGVLDAHFLGTPAESLEESDVDFILSAHPNSLIHTYNCLLSLKNVFLPFEGCDGVSVEELQLNLLQYMQTYLATVSLMSWLNRFKMVKKGLSNNQRTVADKTIRKIIDGNEMLHQYGRSQFSCETHHAMTKQQLNKNVEEEVAKYTPFIRSLSMVKKTQIAAQLGSYFQVLTNLVKLNLNNCLLDSLPGIDQCRHLVSLNLLKNRFTTIPEELCSLQGTLQDLDLKENPITSLPDFICGFTLLTKLSVSYIRELPEDFGNLQRLGTLTLEHTMLTRLPNSFRKLKQLEYLKISGVPWPFVAGKAENITKGNWMILFENLEAEKTLGVTEQAWEELFDEHDIDRDGQLTVADEVPNFLEKVVHHFPRLGQGQADDEEKGKMPSGIFACRRLRFLKLHYTAITAVPEEIQYLSKLVDLDLGGNPVLENISTEVGKLRKLKALHVPGCPKLRTPPPEIVSQGNAALMAYLRRLSQGSVACFSTKLMFVGLGGAGKTSLMRALMSEDKCCPETKGEAITDGIDITSWKVPYHGDTLTFSVWDFAGQTVYYNTHQFFLSKRAVYVLVWNTRLGYEHSGLNFWLASIACHTPRAPIFVVGTHADKVSKAEIPMQKMKERFPNIVGFMKVSSHSGEGVDDLLNKLTEVTFEQPYIGERIPEAWLSFEKLILGNRYQASVMTWTAIEKMAAEAAISGAEVRRAVLFLHERGTLQYFDNELLRDRVIISPQWIVDVMACVVSVKDSPVTDGQLEHEDIKKIWKAYPVNLHTWLLGLTEVFDLTFPLSDRPVNIVPCLLPKEEPKIEWPLLSDDMVEMKMVYTFDYLPAGLFNRAQVRLYQFSDSTAMWKEGSILKKNNHTALVKQTKETEVMVKVIGVKPENILLLVHEVFEGLITDFFQGVKYEYHLPCMDCIRKDPKEQAMFSSRIMYRAVQSKALFLQCHLHFHTLSISTVQQVLMPSSGADYDVQLETAIQDLENLHEDLEHDVFFMYCSKDVPEDVMDSDRVHPQRLALDLKEAGFKCLYEEDLENKKVTDLILTMRNCKMFLVLISDDFVADPHCQRLFEFMLANKNAQFILLMVGKGREWRQSNLGMKVSELVFINFQRMNQYDDRLDNLIEKVSQKLGKSQEEDSAPPNVFLSYCWSNSATSISDGIARAKDGSVGAGDPRQMKKFLEDEGLKVWLDIEQTGKAGLFEDIAAGMKKAKVVVACVSDEYVQSPNCQMEFRFAHIALRMPMVVAVVGTGSQWEATEIGMLSLGYPKVNFVMANNLSHQMLLQHVMERVNAATSEEKIERPMSSANNSQKEMAFQELYELAQRKFLRQISSYVEQTDNYPRLFVVDLNYDPNTTSQQRDVDVDDLAIDVSDAGEEGPPRRLLEDMESGMFCIKTLCEHEGGWHAVTDGISVEIGGVHLMKVWQLFAPYMARILAILKHSNVNLHIIQHPEGGRIHSVMEQRASVQPQVDLKPLYQLIREYVINKDQEMKRGGLARCHMPSGKFLWLCEEHRAGPRITELPIDEEEDNFHGYTGAESPENILIAELKKMHETAASEKDKEESGATPYTARPTSARPLSTRPKSNLTNLPQKPKENQAKNKATAKPAKDKDTKPPKTPSTKAKVTDKATSSKVKTTGKATPPKVSKEVPDSPVVKQDSNTKSGNLSTKEKAERKERRLRSAGSASKGGDGNATGHVNSSRRTSETTGSRPATFEEKANIAAKVNANMNGVNGSQACVIL